MILIVSQDLQTINIQYESILEKEQMAVSMKKFIRNAKFRARGRWKGDVFFLYKNGTEAKIGMWHKIKGVCDKFGFPFKVYGLKAHVFHEDITEDEVRWFCMELMKGHPQIRTIRDRQISAVYKLVKFRYCLGNLATSAGKSLIIFLYIMFLRHKKLLNKVVLICHDADSVIQLHDEFVMYANAKFKLYAAMVHGGTKVTDIRDHKIIIGNFQTLSNRPVEFFRDIDIVIADEAQRATNDSIKYITESCGDTTHRIGVSGSLQEDDSADMWQLYERFGPVVCTVKKKELMDSGDATPIDIKVFILNWATEEQRKYLSNLRVAGKMTDIEMLHIEQEMVRNSTGRMRWISGLVEKANGNMLVLFNDVKGGYGKRLVELFKSKNRNREVYYIDGSVDAEMRDIIKKRMEDGKNKILVATYATYGTGKSIKNLHWIVCAESMKGYNIIAQGQGRGMRLHDDKSVYHWIDIVDDISILDEVYNNRNYMMKQFDERLKLYKNDGFDFEIHRITITESDTKEELF